jgi:hypothetical protein
MIATLFILLVAWLKVRMMTRYDDNKTTTSVNR